MILQRLTSRPALRAANTAIRHLFCGFDFADRGRVFEQVAERLAGAARGATIRGIVGIVAALTPYTEVRGIAVFRDVIEMCHDQHDN